MPSGRPRKPIAIRALEGDTRKLGANVFAESIAEAFTAKPGIPPEPAIFTAPKGATPDRAIALAAAKKHWQYLAENLHREGLLSVIDEGMVTAAALAYGEMVAASKYGNPRFDAIMARYMQAADRMGLHAASRAKFKAPKPAMDDLETALCQ